MARTRAQDKAQDQAPGTEQQKPTSKSEDQKDVKPKQPKKAAEPKAQKSTKAATTTTTKRTRKDDEKSDNKDVPQSSKTTKKHKTTSNSKSEQPSTEPPAAATQASTKTPNPKLSTLLSKYGTKLPLEDTSLPSPTQPTPSTLLAHLLNAMLTSARISHSIASRTVSCLIEAGYHDLDTLKKTSWEERTQILTEGGYTHYREKTATMLGDLAELITSKYQGDLNNMLKATNSSPAKIRKALKEIKGIGDVGVDIFFDTVQGVWPVLAPFLDPRSVKVVGEIGGLVEKEDEGVVQELWQCVGRDPVEMCRLAGALTRVRLENRAGEFK